MAMAGSSGDEEFLRAVDANLEAFGRHMGAMVPPPASLFPVGGDRYGVWTRAHADTALEEVLPGAGFTLVLDLPVMVLFDHPVASAQALSPGCEIRRVVDEAGAADFRIASLGPVDDSSPGRAVIESVFGLDPGDLFAPEVAAFVAYVDGAPAAAALSFTDGVASHIGWVGTVPGYRRRGLGSAVIRAAVCAGFDLGARVAVLEPSTMAEALYLALGFRHLTRYRIWLAGSLVDGSRGVAVQ